MQCGSGSSCSLKRTDIRNVREIERADDAAFDIIIKPETTTDGALTAEGKHKNVYLISSNEDDINNSTRSVITSRCDGVKAFSYRYALYRSHYGILRMCESVL